MRIALVIWNLEGGGAERVLSILANHWAKRGWDVHLLTLDSDGSPIVYELDPAVVVHPVGIDTPPSSERKRHVRLPVTMRLIPAIRKLRPDAVIAFMSSTNIRVLIATVGTRVPIFVCERWDPWTNPIGPERELLRSLLYRRAAAVVVQSDEAMSFFSRRIQTRGSVIPNPVLRPPSPHPALTSRKSSQSRKVISIGRFCQEKRFDRLLTAFAKVAPSHPEWSLEIWGDGNLRDPLERMVDVLGVKKQVRMPGFTRQPYACLSEADLFVLSSDTEGFPNALCEAMACGLPVVSVDCPSGPRQIIRHGVDGLLTPAGDTAALAAAMDRLMGDAVERVRLSSRAPEIIERFGVNTVMGLWDRLFEQHIRGFGLSPNPSTDADSVTSCVE